MNSAANTEKSVQNIQKTKTWMKVLLSQFKVYVTQIKTMEMLIHYISTGDYVFYATGKITVDNALQFAEEFETVYRVNDSKDVRYMKKKGGKSNCQVVIFANPKTDYLQYWLMSTKGQGFFFKINQYKNVHKKSERITLVDNYELASYENPVTKKITFSWRLNDYRYREIMAAGVDAIKHENKESLKNIILETQKLRGFALVRRQYADFLKVWTNELKNKYKKTIYINDITGLIVKQELPKFKKVTETRDGVNIDFNLFAWYQYQIGQKTTKTKQKKIEKLFNENVLTEEDIKKEKEMSLIKMKAPQKVKFTMMISKNLHDELQAEISKLPKDFEIDFDDYAKKIIKELKAYTESLISQDTAAEEIK